MPKSDQGVDQKRYCVIPRTLIFLFQNDQVLLIKGNKKKNLWAEKYNGLGGHVEAGEDIYSSAYRELEEESGLTGIALQLCGIVMCNVEPHMGVGLYVFKGQYQQGTLVSGEEGQLSWIGVSQIDEINIVDDLRKLIPRAYGWKPADGVFSALNAYDDAGKLTTTFFKTG